VLKLDAAMRQTMVFFGLFMEFHKEAFFMKNDFRENGRIRVHYFSSAERRKLLDVVESIGIPIGDLNKGKYKYRPTDTNTFEINIKEKTIQYIGQPFIGAAMCSSGVRFYSVTEFCRLAELEFKVMPRFLLWHIPHDGWKYPVKLLSSVCIPREMFDAYHEKMRDNGVRKLIPGMYAYQSATEHFDISRLLCDVERFIGPGEVMEQYGMGYCYEKVYDGTVIKEISDALKDRTMQYYAEHHKRVDEKCGSHPQVLLFDMHSYSDDIVPEDFLDAGRPTPDVCVGTDPKYTPLSLSIIAKYRFEEAGFTAAQNYPYAGCYVPNSTMAGKNDCLSIMLEFNKRIYLDGNGQVDEKKAAVIRGVLEKIIADSVYLGEREGTSWRRFFADDGNLIYEGIAAAHRPLGEGKAYYSSGKIYQEGMFDDKGLLFGREYYPTGQLRFEGIYKHRTGYGPNYPVYGRFFDLDGNAEFDGPFQIKHVGSMGYPTVAVPESFGSVVQQERPKLYDLRSDVVWETLKKSSAKRP
jgi:N-formylglutamate amidohydrolase